MGSTTVAGAQSSTQPHHATGNVSNFLWLLCIPMNGDRRSERSRKREREVTAWRGAVPVALL